MERVKNPVRIPDVTKILCQIYDFSDEIWKVLLASSRWNKISIAVTLIFRLWLSKSWACAYHNAFDNFLPFCFVEIAAHLVGEQHSTSSSNGNISPFVLHAHTHVPWPQQSQFSDFSLWKYMPQVLIHSTRNYSAIYSSFCSPRKTKWGTAFRYNH